MSTQNKEEQDVGFSTYVEVIENYYRSLDAVVDFTKRDDEDEEVTE